MKRDLEQPVEMNAEQIEFFDAMHDEFGPPIYNFLSLEVANPEDAEDMLQDIFFTLTKNIKKVMGYDRPGAWLRKVAVNHLKHYYRTKKRRRAEVPLEELKTEPEVYDAGFGAVEEEPPDLTEYEKAMFYLQMDGFTEKEIAEKLRMNYGTCRVKFSRIRAKLRSWWDSR